MVVGRKIRTGVIEEKKMKNFSKLIVCLFALFAMGFLSCSSVFAKTITTCKDEGGYSYYFPGGIVPKSKAGWHKDDITDGLIVFKIEGGKPNIIFRDATGITKSVKEQGATVKILHSDQANGMTLVLVDYGVGVLESYNFHLDQSGNGVVAVGQAKATGSFFASNLLISNCKNR